jgi:hypothetical protein
MKIPIRDRKVPIKYRKVELLDRKIVVQNSKWQSSQPIIVFQKWVYRQFQWFVGKIFSIDRDKIQTNTILSLL